jgi:hypothetical protein
MGSTPQGQPFRREDVESLGRRKRLKLLLWALPDEHLMQTSEPSVVRVEAATRTARSGTPSWPASSSGSFR